jgi:hypothetical protein
MFIILPGLISHSVLHLEMVAVVDAAVVLVKKANSVARMFLSEKFRIEISY